MRGVAEKADLFYELAMAVADGLAVADDAVFQLAGAKIWQLEVILRLAHRSADQASCSVVAT